MKQPLTITKKIIIFLFITLIGINVMNAFHSPFYSINPSYKEDTIYDFDYELYKYT